MGINDVKSYSPQQVAEILLRKIKDDAEPQVRQLLGADDPRSPMVTP